MPLPAATLHYPHDRVLLNRTRLAYVHLRNLLTDAKRDRAAKVYGYVAVWLPEELLLLYLQEGEVVNATATVDGAHFRSLSIAEAVAMVPSAAEFGEICFYEADDEQLATMYWSQVLEPVSWPAELNVHDSAAVFAFLSATMHDGVVEVHAEDGGVNYGIVRNGNIARGFFADPGTATAEARLTALLGKGAAAQTYEGAYNHLLKRLCNGRVTLGYQQNRSASGNSIDRADRFWPTDIDWVNLKRKRDQFS